MDKLEYLPEKESMKYRFRYYEKFWPRYKYRRERQVRYSDGKMNVYDYAQRIINEFIDKPFSDAYSKFCKNVPIRFQKVLYQYVKEDSYIQSKYLKYILDDNDIIRINNNYYFKRQRKKGFWSFDYKTEIRHIFTNELRTFDLRKYTKKHSCLYKDVVVQGFVIKDLDRNTDLYRRYKAEDNIQVKKNQKKRKYNRKTKEYKLTSESELSKTKERLFSNIEKYPPLLNLYLKQNRLYNFEIL